MSFLLALLLACGAPKAELVGGALSEALQAPAGDADFDHGAYARVLTAVRYAAGRVDYDAVDLAALDAYLASLATVDLAALSPNERQALLINAYNAFTLKLILEQPTRPASIRDLPDPWKTRRWTLAGYVVSLDDIEHGLLRPFYKDPRLHFALNCASIGCPPLAPSPYLGARLDDQLSAATRDALSRPQHLRIEDGNLAVSKLLDWYGGDFTAPDWAPVAPSKPEWLATYGPDQVRALVSQHGAATPLRFIDYDWALNDVAP